MRLFTNSELKTFRRCRRRWYLEYFRKLSPIRTRISVSRETGTVIHEALADFYSRGTDPFATVAYAIAVLSDENGEEAADDIARIERYANTIIEGYIAWLAEEGADQDLQLVSAEEEISAEILPGVGVAGKLDARFQRLSDGARVFMDHKVVADLTSFPQWAHLDTQFKHYRLLEQLVKPEDEWSDGGIINMLRRVLRTGRANPPFYARHEVRHNLAALRTYWYHVNDLILQIQQLETVLGSKFANPTGITPSPSRDCTWECPYFSVCPMMDSGEDWEGYLDIAFAHSDPMDRYDSL